VRRPFTPGRRFFATFGYSLLQAAIFGSTVAALLYFRVPRAEVGEPLATHALTGLRRRLEAAEQPFYDWRARELGRASTRSDAEVVLVALDEETLANARRGDRAALGGHPWPRSAVGDLVDRILVEGARLVVIDLPLWDASSSCPATDQPRPWAGDDDQLFRAALDRHPGKTMLVFRPLDDQAFRSAPQPRPFLALVEHRQGAADARETVRRILADRRPAYVVPDGKRVQVWAGAATEEEARSVLRLWDVKGPTQIRELQPSDRAHEVSPVDLLVSLGAVTVEGMDPQRVPRVRSLQHPYAPLIGSRSLYGGVALAPDQDGVVRGIPHLVNYAPREGQVQLLPSAPLAVAMHLAGTRQLRYRNGRLWVGDRYSVPVDESGHALLRWEADEAARDARGSLKRVISAWRLWVNLEDQRQGLPPHFRNDLEGRVVVLVDATSYTTDRVSTPIGPAVPGGAVLAQAAVNLLKSDAVERVDPRWDAVAAFVLAFLGAFLALTFATSIRTAGGILAYLLAVAGVAAAYLWMSRQIFVEDRLWLAVAGPLGAMAVTTAFSMANVLRLDRRFREFLQAALGRNLSPETIRLLSNDPNLLHPERRQVTVLRVRLEGFSQFMEKGTPEQVAGLLQEYLFEVTSIIRQSGGQVDKHLGDETLAFWGAPVRTDRHPHLCCETALDLLERADRSRRQWQQRFGHEVDLRIGLESGEVLAGDMGSDVKSNYSVLGEAVRMAGRLCGETKRYGAKVLVGEGTARVASDEFVFREVDRIRPPGTTLPTQIFELWGRRADLDERGQERLALYERGLVAYHERRFGEALELMRKCSEDREDPIAALYVRRCEQYLQHPPPADWDGVWA
jgi:adenylate cyclase